MIVTCQNCDANFSLNDALVKKTGSKVRCSKCKHVFVIYPDASPEPEMLPTDVDRESSSVPQGFGVGGEVSAPEGQLRSGDMDGIAAVGGDLDLSEIEKMLATDGQDPSKDWDSTGKPDGKVVEEKPPAVELPAVSTGALDLSEIEQIFDMGQDLDDAGRTLESEPEDLLFDMEESAVHTKESQKELGDFDMADIEKMLEEEMVENETEETGGLLFTPNASPSSAPVADDQVEDDDEPFAFSDIDEMMETDAAVGADSDAGSEEDGMILKMDDDFKPVTPSLSPESAPEIEELDFSDIEGMMETDARVPEDAAGEDEEEELTLALDSDERFETPSSDSPEGPDLSMLDELLKEKEPEPSDEVSLELDIADIAPASSAASVADDLVLKFDEIDTEDQAVADPGVETGPGQPMETEDLDLEFNDEQLDEALAATEETAQDAASPAEEEEPAEAEDEQTEAAAFVTSDIEPAKARQSRKAPVFVLVVLLLVGAAVGGHLLFGDSVFEFLSKKGIEIPLLSNLKKPAVQDAGNLKITTIDIESRFVENSATGRLFIVSGKARNGYAGSRSLIRVTGKLYSKGKQLVNTETVYCGNEMTGQELSTLSLEEIKNRLENPKGNNDANVNIKPGEDRPFMVVFSKLPENLEEFTLEVAGSESAAQLP